MNKENEEFSIGIQNTVETYFSTLQTMCDHKDTVTIPSEYGFIVVCVDCHKILDVLKYK